MILLLLQSMIMVKVLVKVIYQEFLIRLLQVIMEELLVLNLQVWDFIYVESYVIS